MSHSCAALLCEEPHRRECTCDQCEVCHETHEWSEWQVWPECKFCLMDMATWIHENTDYDGCPLPELCTYSKECEGGRP